MSYYYLNLALLTVVFSMNVLFATDEEGNDEKALYAISSLRYFLEEMENPSPDDQGAISFEESDIEALWDKAKKCSLHSQVVEAHELYIKGISGYGLDKSKSSLAKIWKKVKKKADKKVKKKKRSRKNVKKRADVDYFEKFITNETPVNYSPYLLPNKHAAKASLDSIFKNLSVQESFANLKKAGFQVISERPSSMKVLYHPTFPKYLIKVYPHDERDNRSLRDTLWAYRRCAGADNIRELLKWKKMKHFSVPRKWIYFVPNKDALEASGCKNSAVLVVDYMDTVSIEDAKGAWRTKINREVLKELYEILSRGYSSCLLYRNIPYTKSKKFTCIDTENIQRILPYNNVKKHISPTLHRYWDRLVRTGGNTQGFQIK